MWKSTGDVAAAWHLRWIALALVSLLLFEGAVYWHLKLRIVRRRAATLPPWFRSVFSALRYVNPLLMLSAAVYMGGAEHATTSDRAWGLFVLALAYVEHVNYFEWQLMHDTAADVAYLRRYRRLRRAPLRRDLHAARKASAGETARR